MYYVTSRAMGDLEKDVLSFLSRGHATRNEIVAGVGVSRTQLGRVATQLIESGAVAVVGTRKSAHGRHSELLGLQNDVAVSAGIAVSRMDMCCVITNYLGECLYRISNEHSAGANPLTDAHPPTAVTNEPSASPNNQWLNELTDFLEQLAQSDEAQPYLSTVVTCGVALPVPMPLGQSYAKKTPLTNSSKENSPSNRAPSQLAHHVSEAVQHALPAASVLIDNTMRMGALGEAFFGAGSSYPNSIYVGISGGVAASVIIDGQLIYGPGGIGGELGHMSVPGATARCHCGKVGCLETLLSYRALCHAAGVANIPQLRAAYLHHEPHAVQTVNKAMNSLAHALSGTILTLGVTAIILGGSVSTEFPELADIFQGCATRELLSTPEWNLSVVPTVLGSWAPAWGATIGHYALR